MTHLPSAMHSSQRQPTLSRATLSRATLATPSRRSVLLAPGLAMASMGLAAVGLSACSFEKSSSGSGSTGGAGHDGTFNLNVFGPRPSFVNNFSPASPAEGIVGTAFLYEQLLWNDRINGNKLKPWLAQDFSFDRSAAMMTVTLRNDVTWSDGVALTADDVVYTVVEMPQQAQAQKAKTELFEYTAKKIDQFKVEFSWPKGKAPLEGDRVVGELRPKPKHIYSKVDLATFTNSDNPVTSSPLTLERFTPQQVTFKVKDNHFSGKIEHVKRVNWVSYGSEDVCRNLLMQGKLDLATISLQNPQSSFIDAKEGNKYWTIYSNNAVCVLFNQTVTPFRDKAVRQAIYAALDPEKLQTLFDVGLKPISPTGLEANVWKDHLKPELKEPHRPDAARAKQLLADAGWTIQGGHLSKGGSTHPVSYKVVSNYTNQATWADGVKAQLKQALGLDIKVLKVPEEQFFAQLDRGEFDFCMARAATGTHIARVYAGLHSSGIKPVGTAADNPSRVADAELDKLLDQALVETDEARLKELGYRLQQRVVDECHIAPLYPGVSFVEASGQRWRGYPDQLSGDVPAPLMYGLPDTWRTLQALRPTS